MKQVWKCDYCSHTNVDPQEVQQHEQGCVFDPANRSCFTCEHYHQDQGIARCDIDATGFDVEVNCFFWHGRVEKIVKKLYKPED